MATTKPRVTVTLEPADYALVRRLSDINGESVSSIIAGLVGAAEPVLRRLVKFGEQFENLSASRRQDLLAELERAESVVVPHAQQLAEEMLAAIDLDPRPVTRGSRPPASPPSPAGNGA